MHTTKLIQDRGIEAIGRFYSRYRGVVLNNQDPDNLQRIEVIVPNIHVGGLKVWARAASQQGGVNYGLKHFTPLPGEVVWVEFEKGNPLKAVWSFHGWSTVEVPEELKSNSVAGMVSPNGNKIILNDTDGVLHISIEKVINISSTETIDIGIPEKCSISFTEDEIKISKGETTVVLSEDGISIQKGSSSLKKTLDDLISAILEIKVTTPQGPGTLDPASVPKFTSIKQELSQYLK